MCVARARQRAARPAADEDEWLRGVHDLGNRLEFDLELLKDRQWSTSFKGCARRVHEEIPERDDLRRRQFNSRPLGGRGYDVHGSSMKACSMRTQFSRQIRAQLIPLLNGRGIAGHQARRRVIRRRALMWAAAARDPGNIARSALSEEPDGLHPSHRILARI